MADKLVIVESPSKAKTIQKYLGAGYRVTASMGHVRDLPKSQLGVDIDHDFAPLYEVTEDKSKVVRELQAAIRGASVVYLATDPDREGEAIAWHITEAAKIGRNTPVFRVEFSEITKRAVQDAIAHPRQLDQNLVDAQQARRVLDRLVGYRLSPLLWDKVKRGLSAGRVQSVAVRLIVEREREVLAFKPQEYWTIEADLSKLAAADAKAPKPFRAVLIERAGKKLDKFAIATQEAADTVRADLEGAHYQVVQVTRKDKRRTAAPPFITSTLQQEAGRKLGFTAKKTMQIAQQLYEGVDIGGSEGTIGLITYMRTDSVNVAKEAQDEARLVITEQYGADYVPEKPNFYKTKAKNAQEAHEAIRPTSAWRVPDEINKALSFDQRRLYDLIWKRFMASQMAAAIFDSTTVDIAAGKVGQLLAHDQAAKGKRPAATAPAPNPYVFRATGSVVKFPGFLAVYNVGLDEGEEDEDKEALLPPLSEGEALALLALLALQHFTQPPPRFTEASLVKELEQLGIGRPSTYAATISTITTREYVEIVEKKLLPTTLGMTVNDLLVQHFASIVDYNFTAQMEQELDEIAGGERPWVPVIRNFWEPFERTLALAKTEMRDVKGEAIPTDLACPTCGNGLVIKWGQRGEFLACSTYPACGFTNDLVRDAAGRVQIAAQPELAEDAQACPTCDKPMILKKSRYGMFLACSGYPECKQTINLKQSAEGALVAQTPTLTDHMCDKCGKPMQQKQGRFGPFLACTGYPECANIVKLDRAGQPKPPAQITEAPCPDCGRNLAIKQGRWGLFLSCTGYPSCRHMAKLPADGTTPRILTPEEVALLPVVERPARKAASKAKAAPKKTVKAAATTTAAKRTTAKTTATAKPAAKTTTRKPAAATTAKPAAKTTATRKPAAATTTRKPAAATIPATAEAATLVPPKRKRVVEEVA